MADRATLFPIVAHQPHVDPVISDITFMSGLIGGITSLGNYYPVSDSVSSGST